MNTVYLNGQFLPIEEARISPLDRGFLFADGVYEVIPVYQGNPFRLEKHLTRWQRSLDAIRLALPEAYQKEALPQLFDELITRNGGGNMSIYLQATRGCPTKRDHAFPTEPTEPTLFIMCSPVKPPMVDQLEQAKGVKAITADDIRWDRCDIKSVSLLPNLLLRQQAIDAGAHESILLKEGYVTEGSASNIFIVSAGMIITPPQKPKILSGVTRDLILELAEEHAIPVEEQPVSHQQLLDADEVWATSSTKEILPIIEIDGVKIGEGDVGPVWKRMAKIYFQFKRSLYGAESD